MPRLRGESEEQFLARTTYNSGTRPYKVYTALLTQTGTNAPVAKVLENTLGAITFSYDDAGSYKVLSSGLFTTDKTALFITYGTETAGIGTVLGTDSIASIVTAVDNGLSDTTFEIRVYI